METGSSILSYKGDANLGLAENTGIPVAAERPDLDAVNQAAQNLRMYDHQNNIMLYQQKIADRDKALQLLAQGKVNSGKILPEDQKYYDKLEQEQTAAYKAIKGIQDKDGIANYMQKTQQLQDLVTNAQHRWIEISKLEEEKAKKTLPKDIEAYDSHIKKQRAKMIGELVDPYQKSFSGDFDKMRNSIRGSQMLTKGVGGQLPPQPQETITVTDANGKQTTKVVTTPNKAGVPTTKKGTTSSSVITPTGGKTELSIFQETPEKYYDYNTMLKRAEQLYLGDPEEGENQRQWFTKFHEAPPFMQKEIIEKYNNRLKEYSEQRGIPPNANGNYPDQIKFQVGPDGKVILNETPASFAAKDALASIEGDYIQKSQKVFDKDIAEYMLDKEKAGADALYKKLMGAAANKKANAYVANIHSQIKAREGDPEEQKKYLDDIFTRNYIAQPELTAYKGNALYPMLLQNENSLPLYRFDNAGSPILVKPFGGTPIIENKKIVGYKGGNFKQRYVYEGRELPFEKLHELYLGALKNIGLTKDKLPFDEYIKSMAENSNSGLSIKILGENGATDKQTNTDALRSINNRVTKKGQEGVFELAEPPTEE